jgi:hypothetical protein
MVWVSLPLALFSRRTVMVSPSLKALQTWRPVRWLLSRLGLARALFALGRLFGEAGSKHLLLVCEPPG